MDADSNLELLKLCRDVWITVKAVLCSDAPEGQTFDEDHNQAEAGSKETLSFCWRALKESR